MAQLSPKLSRRILGAVAVATGVSLTFGAAQFAFGRDISGVAQSLFLQSAQAQENPSQIQVQQAAILKASAINRAGKSDRAENAAKVIAPSQTFSLQLNGHPDTSVLVRIPLVRETRNLAPVLTPSQDRKLACEPTVSVLTEISRQLQPGRCIT